MTTLFPYARVRVPEDLKEVTSHGPEGDPRIVAMTSSDVEAIWTAVERLYQTGTQPAIAFCLRRHGQVVLNRAIGHSHGNAPGDTGPGVLATPDTPFCVFSASKAITAMVIHLLDGRNLLRLDDRIEEYIPEFGTKGKQRTTLRHVLTHRAGIPSVAGDGNDVEMLTDDQKVLRLLCDAAPTSVPGRRLAYHAITGGFILGEVVRRITGKGIREFLRDEVQRPLGFRWFNYGVSAQDVGAVAHNAVTGFPLPPGAAMLVRRALGVGFGEAVTVSNDARYLTAVVPSGNLVSTAPEMAAFYQVLLNEGELDGVRIFDRRTVRRALTETSYLEADLTLGLPVRYGLGLMLGAKWLSPYGPGTSKAFGHYGFVNVITWADPARGVAAALLTSGKPFLGPHLLRLWDVLSQVAHRCSRSRSKPR
jgi:CubicO group peptidase (beta-lactamase class C family)